MTKKRNIVLVWRTGGKYKFRDVQLLVNNITKWNPGCDVICLTDIIENECKLMGVTFFPLKYKWEGWWAKLNLFNPDLEKYRPFLYLDLDTAVVGNLDDIYPLDEYQEKLFIALEDFYQPGQLASGVLWIPEKSEKISKVWGEAIKKKGVFKKHRLDYFLRQIIKPDLFFQHYNDAISSFKPNHKQLTEIPEKVSVVCFHGKPTMNEVKGIEWVNKYIKY